MKKSANQYKFIINKILIILLIILINRPAVKSQDLVWKTNLSGLGNNIAGKSAIDADNNIYVLGYFDNTCNISSGNLVTRGLEDVFIAKYSPDGSLLWAKSLGSSSSDIGTSIVISPDNQFVYITGIFQSRFYADNNWDIISSGGGDAFLAKYKANGDIVWLKNIGSASVATNQRPNEIKFDKNNNLIIGGIFGTELKIGTTIKDTTLYATNQGMFIAKLDTSGFVIKAKKFEATNTTSRLYTLDVDTSGYYLAGHFKGNLITDLGTYPSNNSSFDMFVYKLDYSLNSKGIIKVAGSGDDQIYSCSTDGKGNFYFGGQFTSPSLTIDSTTTGIFSKRNAYNKTTDGKTDIFFAKYRYDGQLQWFNTAGSTGNDYLYRALYKNGNFIAAGQYSASLTFNNKTIVPKDNADAFAIVQNQNDNLVYLLPFGGLGIDVGETAVVDNNGNFVVIGDYASPKLYIGTKDSITNSNSGTKDMFIVKYDKGSITKVVTPITCSGTVNGAINLTPEGTVVAPYTYSWTKDGDAAFSATTSHITGLSAGKYRVTFTDALGYIKKDSVTLTNPTPINIALDSSRNVTCYNGANGKIFITPTGGSGSYTYSWSSTNGSGIDAIAQDQTTLTKGTYYITVTDLEGCTASLSAITLTQPERISFKGTTVTRKNGHPGEVYLSVQGGTPAYSYQWTGPGTYTANTEDILGLANAGDYRVVVTDAKLCTTDTTVLVPDATVFMAYTGAINDVKCFGGNDGSASIIVENTLGNISYTWSNGASGAIAYGLTAGDYNVTVTDDQIGSVQVKVHIDQPATGLTVSISKTDITCHGANNGIADSNPAGGTMPYSYVWKKDGTAFDGGSEVQYGLSAGVYAVTVTDANGCTASNSNTIVNPDEITFTGTVTAVTCENSTNDGAIALSNVLGGTGAFSYQWSNGFTIQNVNKLPIGNYSVTITDVNNCKANASYVIGYDAPISLSMTVSSTKCFGSTDGAIDLNISGGHPDLTYSWSTGAVTQNIKDLAPGSYSVTVTDAKNCKSISSGSVVEPQALIISSHTVYDATSNDPWNGKIEVVASGGTEPYLYTLNTGPFNGTGIFNCLSSGSYSVAVNDANNCGPVNTGTLYISYITAIPGASEVTLKLYPNPVSEYLHITYNKAVQKDLIIELLSLNGKIIRSEKIDSHILSETYIMDIQGLAKGIYLIKIDGILSTEKIIKL
jgi:hypothetical protein